MLNLLSSHDLILMEAAILERLRRNPSIQLHPELQHALLIYETKGVEAFKRIYHEYIDIAFDSNLPLILCTPTWKANKELLQKNSITANINKESAQFVDDIRSSYRPKEGDVLIGGLIGCKNDSYKPSQCLSVNEAVEFHAWQIAQLAETKCDFLFAATMPNVEEALGIAKCMSEHDKPYVISFVISSNGLLLDGTNLKDAILKIDSETIKNPVGYMINCAYPSFIINGKYDESVYDRLIGYQGNSSSLTHEELNNAPKMMANPVAEWGDQMLTLNQKYTVKILGGCCGTSGEHLKYLVNHYK